MSWTTQGEEYQMSKDLEARFAVLEHTIGKVQRDLEELRGDLCESKSDRGEPTETDINNVQRLLQSHGIYIAPIDIRAVLGAFHKVKP